MEGRKRSRALSRTVYSAQKRLLAFVLAAAMILTNVGADMNTALAATSSESVTFSMSGSQLVKAIDEAIADGNEVTAISISPMERLLNLRNSSSGRGKSMKHSLIRMAEVWTQN